MPPDPPEKTAPFGGRAMVIKVNLILKRSSPQSRQFSGLFAKHGREGSKERILLQPI